MISSRAAISAPTRLVRAPLILVLCQVRFSPVLRMPEWVPAIQGELKTLGFVRFEKSQVQSLTLTQGEAPKIQSEERWDFLNRERMTCVSLTSSFVVLQTSEYSVFAEFAKMLENVLSILEDRAEVEIVERLGIRYVDLIRPKKNESYTKYLKPSLIGFPFSELGDALIRRSFSTIQSIAETTDGRTLVVKCLPTNTGQFLPPDLSPSSLKFDVELQAGDTGAILDFDHYATVDLDFDTKDIVTRIDALHRLANEAFRHAVSDHALSVWGDKQS